MKDQHTKCYIWSTPRSISTALLKCFSMHSDVDVIHEPFCDAFYHSKDRYSDRYGDYVDGLCDANILMDSNNSGNITNRVTVVKDLAFQASNYVSEEILSSGYHIFLIRHPALVYNSLIKLKPDFNEDEFGFTSLKKMIDKSRQIPNNAFCVVDGEDFRANPIKTLTYLFQNMGLKFSDDILYWDDGSIKKWASHEADSQKKWHSELENSVGIFEAEYDYCVGHFKNSDWYLRALRIYNYFLALKEK